MDEFHALRLINIDHLRCVTYSFDLIHDASSPLSNHDSCYYPDEARPTRSKLEVGVPGARTKYGPGAVDRFPTGVHLSFPSSGDSPRSSAHSSDCDESYTLLVGLTQPYVRSFIPFKFEREIRIHWDSFISCKGIRYTPPNNSTSFKAIILVWRMIIHLAYIHFPCSNVFFYFSGLFWDQ